MDGIATDILGPDLEPDSSEESDAPPSPASRGAAATPEAILLIRTGAESNVDLPLVAGYWRDVDLEGLQKSMDEQASEIASAQESALAQRKQLAEATKEFRRTVEKTDPIAKACGTLLRQYQARRLVCGHLSCSTCMYAHSFHHMHVCVRRTWASCGNCMQVQHTCPCLHVQLVTSHACALPCLGRD